MCSHGDGVMSYKALIKVISKDGWKKVGQKGSHQQFTHPIKKGRVTVPYKITKNIQISILKQAGLR